MFPFDDVIMNEVSSKCISISLKTWRWVRSYLVDLLHKWSAMDDCRVSMFLLVYRSAIIYKHNRRVVMQWCRYNEWLWQLYRCAVLFTVLLIYEIYSNVYVSLLYAITMYQSMMAVLTWIIYTFNDPMITCSFDLTDNIALSMAYMSLTHAGSLEYDVRQGGWGIELGSHVTDHFNSQCTSHRVYGLLLYNSWASHHYKLLHMARQLGCCGMCNIL